MKIHYYKKVLYNNVNALFKLHNLNNDSENIPSSDYDKVHQAIVDQTENSVDVCIMFIIKAEFNDKIKK